jgi:hypothetical protein
MSDFSKYNIPESKYKRMFASYLQNEGTQLMNKVLFKYQLVNNFKERVVEFWSLFDIDWLENEYITWKRANSSTEDSEWIYTDFLEKICKSYQITREYYSYWAITTDNPDDPGNKYETGNILLNNLNMIRLLKMKRSAIGYDGTRESLVEILSSSLNNKYSTDANSKINFILKTQTETHASLLVYIIKPATASGDIVWTNYDLYLAKDNEYFVQLLGIVTTFEVIDGDTMVYDISPYDVDVTPDPDVITKYN